ncbi:hypothetical protein X797_011789 [Metarhizium robertsii]|uniref:Uncharacterized protein n=1 Tax=Metarhizium robertsii TaxID=568076 RepID=A0A014N605_9HYPO|nr:hypothetical protein X797_011789 [Metarhizium robertsii]
MTPSKAEDIEVLRAKLGRRMAEIIRWQFCCVGLDTESCDTAPPPCLRNGLDQNVENGPYLPHTHNDVILRREFSRNDRSYSILTKALESSWSTTYPKRKIQSCDGPGPACLNHQRRHMSNHHNRIPAAARDVLDSFFCSAPNNEHSGGPSHTDCRAARPRTVHGSHGYTSLEMSQLWEDISGFTRPDFCCNRARCWNTVPGSRFRYPLDVLK